MRRPCRSHCPIAYALDLFGDKWSLLVLRDLLFMGKRRYNEFLASEEGISTNILAERLRRLEAEGLLTKSHDRLNHRQVVYAPTRKSLDLLPVLLEIIRWSAKHDPKTVAPPAFIRRLRNNRKGLMRNIVNRFV
ncbi:MAG: helix-turn-helix transcriptional regulator [Candidatus Omnitrophica bacterium]|nr:helix-turn-helix transcriptional regulator [Candidatus Omnitrophota bacterium]